MPDNSNGRLCSVDGCGRSHLARGYCGAHYSRVMLLGHPDAERPVAIKSREPRFCSVKGCGRKHAGRGFCTGHFQRWKKTGDPDPQTSLSRLKSGGRHIDSNGYVLVWRGGPHYAKEHRLVMAEALGRPLRSDETVHHKNGDRADNRPENLEVWIGRHGRGQSLTERIDDAVALLNEYAPDLLSAEAKENGCQSRVC